MILKKSLLRMSHATEQMEGTMILARNGERNLRKYKSSDSRRGAPDGSTYTFVEWETSQRSIIGKVGFVSQVRGLPWMYFHARGPNLLSVQMALAELEEWRLWRPDITKAYRATYATKRLRINDDLHFGEQERRDCLMEFGFKPCPHEPNIYVRKVGDDYDYGLTYVDDTCLVINSCLLYTSDAADE